MIVTISYVLAELRANIWSALSAARQVNTGSPESRFSAGNSRFGETCKSGTNSRNCSSGLREEVRASGRITEKQIAQEYKTALCTTRT